MQINRQLGIIYDSIFYSVICFSKENVRSVAKEYMLNENDIFESYYEFKNKYELEPPESLYPFFYFNGRIFSVLQEYFYKNFDFFNGTVQSFIQTDKSKIKNFTLHYLLKPFEKEINFGAVIRGDDENTTKALALLTSAHNDNPMQIHNLFYNFDALFDELIKWLRESIHMITLFRNKNKSLIESSVNEFLESEKAKFLAKGWYPNKKINLSKQTFAVSLFNSGIIYHYPLIDNKLALIIGNYCCNTSYLFEEYQHITKKSFAKILDNEIINKIIDILYTGEKTITQLSVALGYSRTTIDKFVRLLYDELVIRKSRKNGNEVYYKINDAYFISAKMAINDYVDKIIKRRK